MHAVTKHRRSFERFMLWLMAMLGVYFLITAILSLTVDPWRINNTPFAIDSLDPAREISNTVRVGKAALANKGDWETVILGSSRIEIGLDPNHPAFDKKRTVNLAMAAANLYETVPAGNYILTRNPQVKTLILGIEAGDLHNDFDSRKYTRYYQSPFSDNNRSIERGINQIIGGRSLADSIATIKRHLNGTSPKRSILGQWLQPNHPGNLRKYVETTFQMGFESADNVWSLRPQKLRQEKAELIAGFIKRVREAGIEMHIVVSPQHALKQIHPNIDNPEGICWEHDLLELVKICKQANSARTDGSPVALWSFLTFNEYTTRSLPNQDAESKQMEGWFDLGHAQPALGNKIIETVFSNQPVTDLSGAAYGVNLLETDWKQLRKNWIAAHIAYCKSHPDDVKWWRSLVAAAASNQQAPRMMAESEE